MPQHNQRSYLWVYKLIIKKSSKLSLLYKGHFPQDQQEMIICITGEKQTNTDLFTPVNNDLLIQNVKVI